MKYIFSKAINTFFLTVLFGLLFSHSLFAQIRNTTEDISIGMLLPLSGEYEAVGKDTLSGIEAAKLEMKHSDKIQFIYADSKAQPLTSISEFKKFLSLPSVAGVFAFRGPVGMAVNPLSRENKLPLLGGVGNKDFTLLNDFGFQLWVPSHREGSFLANKIIEKKYTRIALITVQDDWPIAISQAIRESLGQSIVLDEEILPSDKDFKTLTTKLKATSPDAIILNIGLSQIGQSLRQIKEQQIPSKIFSNFWVGKKDVLDSAREAAEGVSFVEMATNLENLKSTLKKLHIESLSGATVSAYVAVLMIDQALETLKSNTRDGLFRALNSLTHIKTNNGVFNINNRIVDFPMTLKTIVQGQVVDDS